MKWTLRLGEKKELVHSVGTWDKEQGKRQAESFSKFMCVCFNGIRKLDI